MQLDTGMSISRYLPAIGTAGLLRDLVSGNSRVPRPPPRISEMTRGIAPLLSTCGVSRQETVGRVEKLSRRKKAIRGWQLRPVDPIRSVSEDNRGHSPPPTVYHPRAMFDSITLRAPSRSLPVAFI